MTEVELRKLSRTDLLEMLIETGKENARLNEKIEELEQKLAAKEISLYEAGSIAEAALQINGVFEAAQKAADQYLENVKRLSESVDERCAHIENEARQKSEQMLFEAKTKCAQMLTNSRLESERYWQDVQEKLERYVAAHSEVSELLKIVGLDKHNRDIVY